MKCIVCGKIGPYDKCSPEAQGWDWFRQYLPETVHFCPQHKNSPKRDEWWQRSQVAAIAKGVVSK